mmetsp:Transcript_97181/g.272010  ORF Transcript_97181/g.272010 Transcript_97181/m.272010 type:complete len:242 (-) Transcript_97181:1217-1942(-)
MDDVPAGAGHGILDDVPVLLGDELVHRHAVGRAPGHFGKHALDLWRGLGAEDVLHALRGHAPAPVFVEAPERIFQDVDANVPRLRKCSCSDEVGVPKLWLAIVSVARDAEHGKSLADARDLVFRQRDLERRAQVFNPHRAASCRVQAQEVAPRRLQRGPEHGEGRQAQAGAARRWQQRKAVERRGGVGAQQAAWLRGLLGRAGRLHRLGKPQPRVLRRPKGGRPILRPRRQALLNEVRRGG